MPAKDELVSAAIKNAIGVKRRGRKKINISIIPTPTPAVVITASPGTDLCYGASVMVAL